MAKKKNSKPTADHVVQARLLKIGRYALVLFVAIPLICAAYFLYQGLFHSGVFVVREIKVQGHHQLTQEDIQGLLQLPKGQKILSVDLDMLVSKLQQHPLVKTAMIQRRLPSTLWVHLEERETYMVLSYGKKYYLIDVDGVALKELPELKPEYTWPVMQGLRFVKGGISLGQVVNAHKVLNAITVLKAFGASKVATYFRIKEVDMSNAKQINLITTEGLKIQLGHDDFEQKLENLFVLMNEKADAVKNASYVDLRFGGVIVRPKK